MISTGVIGVFYLFAFVCDFLARYPADLKLDLPFAQPSPARHRPYPGASVSGWTSRPWSPCSVPTIWDRISSRAPSYPWTLIPALFVIVIVLAFNFAGDGLRDAADPYSRT